MIFKFRSTQPTNAWLQQDRTEQRKLIGTALAFGGAVVFGFGLLIYALIAA